MPRTEAGKKLLADIREMAQVIHHTDSLRDHADPNDNTGWNLGPIETCVDPYCVEGRDASAAIESIENEAEHQGYLRANDCDHSECIEREEQARLSERNRIIEVIANIPVTIQFREPVTKIDLWQYHADVIKAIMKAQR